MGVRGVVGARFVVWARVRRTCVATSRVTTRAAMVRTLCRLLTTAVAAGAAVARGAAARSVLHTE